MKKILRATNIHVIVSRQHMNWGCFGRQSRRPFRRNSRRGFERNRKIAHIILAPKFDSWTKLLMKQSSISNRLPLERKRHSGKVTSTHHCNCIVAHQFFWAWEGTPFSFVASKCTSSRYDLPNLPRCPKWIPRAATITNACSYVS